VSSRWLISVDKALAGEGGVKTILKKNLHGLKDKPWDDVLTDCPRALIRSLNALIGAHQVLVPFMQPANILMHKKKHENSYWLP